ncbi:MAG: GldG family protein, partial [Stellaceae bacterium]
MRRFFASRRAVAFAALCCLAVMLVSVNIIAARFLGVRLDLTADHLYTLSPGTLHTLARIDEPITLHFYYSRRLGDAVPAYGVYAARVREMLDQYVAAAHSKLRLEIFDPAPFSRLEDRAVADGLQAVPLDSQGDQVYFGLAGTNSTDDRQVIPFFSRQREPFLEYDLTRLIHNLAVPQKTVVGLLTSLPMAGNPMAMMQGRPSAPMAILEELRQLYKVKPLDDTLAAIAPDIDVLMLVQPPKLPEKMLFAIDQFVLKGGKALIFVDPHSELRRGG